ncbi:MAG: GAF domain-containing protein [Ktedonobacteraceae bacterium]|nr:GAF domain-containing protein [Ktedonobacteraceae bacterium]MBO0792180.1 GAF domain-containing protein [Ktedonobacteraceae bacterium]
MQKAHTWRALLKNIIQDPKEKQRILEELGITAITLNRWIAGDTDPRPQNLRLLITALAPKHRDRIVELLSEEKGHGDVLLAVHDNTPLDVSTQFYTQVLEVRSSISENLRFWNLCELIVNQALKQIDPDEQGVYIWVAQCMPPSGPQQKVRSLRETLGRATSPWPGKLDEQAMFLGAESLTGSVVTSCRPAIVQNIDAVKHTLPIRHMDHEKSVAIYPILYAGRVGGALLVGSALINYFVSPARTTLIQYYADLLSLAFEQNDFYSADSIALHIMPPQNRQKNYFSRLPQLQTQAIEEDHHDTSGITFELRPWQKLESMLLELPIQQGSDEEEQDEL